MSLRTSPIVKSRTETILAWFLLLAIVLRAAVPTGFMPDIRAESSFTLVVCTPHGLTTRTVDESGQSLPSGSQDEVDSFCAFAGVGFSSLPPAPSDALPEQMSRDAASLHGNSPAPHVLVIHGALGARAPPKAFSRSA